VRVAVVGLGDVSHVHLAAIAAHPRAELVAVCDIDRSRTLVAPQVPFFSAAETMLATTPLDCVHVCVPHHQHLAVTKQVVAAGVHVLCEKPVAHTLHEAMEFAALAAAHPELVVAICLQNRYNATVRTLLHELASHRRTVTGVRGSVLWCRPPSYFNAKPWRGSMETAGGGALINQAIHTLDLLQLVGGTVQSVSASLATLSDNDIDVEDSATVHLEFASGATGFFTATNVNHANESIELIVATDGGHYLLRDNQLLFRNGEGDQVLAQDEQVAGTQSYYGPGHRLLIHELYDAIDTKTNSYVHVQDAMPVMMLIDAARRSSELGHRVLLSPPHSLL
jgi:UDP-N-acetyl-2-amino-2-deoxyglucuronate dehydrogenase